MLSLSLVIIAVGSPRCCLIVIFRNSWLLEIHCHCNVVVVVVEFVVIVDAIVVTIAVVIVIFVVIVIIINNSNNNNNNNMTLMSFVKILNKCYSNKRYM